MALLANAKAGELKVFPLWDTVSPDGKYAVGWSSTRDNFDPDDMPYPYETDQGIENWVIEVATRKRIMQLPGYAYWVLPSGYRRSHFDLTVEWSADSRTAVAKFDERYATAKVFFIDVAANKIIEGFDQMCRAFKKVLVNTADRAYARQADTNSVAFGGPRMVNDFEFTTSGLVQLGKNDASGEHALWFRVDPHTNRFTLIKCGGADANKDADADLNVAYRQLIGLLTPEKRQTLIEEQRAWLKRRDETPSKAEKDKMTQERTSELDNRQSDRVQELRAKDLPLEKESTP
jgi:uncharacterized protein YecT (DUF1311 family)